MDSSFEKSHWGADSIKETAQTQSILSYTQFEESTWESAAKKWNLKQNNIENVEVGRKF